MRDIENPQLSPRPNEWTLAENSYEGRYYQRWLPGAFGDRADIAMVTHFIIDEDEWEERMDGVYRTIKKARIMATAPR